MILKLSSKSQISEVEAVSSYVVYFTFVRVCVSE